MLAPPRREMSLAGWVDVTAALRHADKQRAREGMHAMLFSEWQAAVRHLDDHYRCPASAKNKQGR